MGGRQIVRANAANFSVPPTRIAVLAKYAGHVRQTSADVRQGSQTLPDILSGSVQYTENVLQMSGVKYYICWSLTEENV